MGRTESKHSSKYTRLLRALLSVTATSSICAMAASSMAGPAAPQKNPESRPGQYVVELKQQRSFYNQVVLERRLGGKIVDQIRPNMILVQRDTRENSAKATRALSALSEVSMVEPNYIFHVVQAPNDTDYSKLWNLNNSGALDSQGTKGIVGIDIGAEKAWEINRGSKDVIVGIIDTGVDYTHPELKNNMWTNVAELNGKAGVDDDGNGYVDDIHGYNFVANNGDPLDDNGHGSHCAGVIGAEGNNGAGIVGVNWNVSIMAIKFLDSEGSGDLDAAIKAIDYAKKSGARILSNSWGGNVVSDILEKAVGETVEAGKLFVAAAGNDSNNNDQKPGGVPGSYTFDNIVSVAALDNRGELAYFSAYGAKTVHVAAPGVNIYSTVKGGGYETMSGTSMATPHVAGIAALMLANDPSLDFRQLKQRLISSSRPLASMRGKTISAGIVDAYYALTGLTPPADPNDPAVWSDHQDSPISSPHPYVEKSDLTFTIHVDGAKRISAHFSKFETEAGYDKLQFQNAQGDVVGTWSGNQTDRFSPIVDGDAMILKFGSDSSVNGYGFDIDYVSIQR